jgi:hypothetical protein
MAGKEKKRQFKRDGGGVGRNDGSYFDKTSLMKDFKLLCGTRKVSQQREKVAGYGA